MFCTIRFSDQDSAALIVIIIALIIVAIVFSKHIDGIIFEMLVVELSLLVVGIVFGSLLKLETPFLKFFKGLLFLCICKAYVSVKLYCLSISWFCIVR
jgi:hypothetical protein